MPEVNRVKYPREAFSFAGTNFAVANAGDVAVDLSTATTTWDTIPVLGTSAYDFGGVNPLNANEYVRLPSGIWYVQMGIIWANDVTGTRAAFVGIQDNRYYPNNFADESIDPFTGDFTFAMGAAIGDHTITGATLAGQNNQVLVATVLIVTPELVNLADSASQSGQGAVHNFLVAQNSGGPLNMASWACTGVKIGECE